MQRNQIDRLHKATQKSVCFLEEIEEKYYKAFSLDVLPTLTMFMFYFEHALTPDKTNAHKIVRTLDKKLQVCDTLVIDTIGRIIMENLAAATEILAYNDYDKMILLAEMLYFVDKSRNKYAFIPIMVQSPGDGSRLEETW